MMAVRKLDDLDADFDLHADVVIEVLHDQETRKLTETILKKIADTATGDFGIWGDAQNNNGATTRPSSSVGPSYDNKEYFPALGPRQFKKSLA